MLPGVATNCHLRAAAGRRSRDEPIVNRAVVVTAAVWNVLESLLLPVPYFAVGSDDGDIDLVIEIVLGGVGRVDRSYDWRDHFQSARVNLEVPAWRGPPSASRHKAERKDADLTVTAHPQIART